MTQPKYRFEKARREWIYDQTKNKIEFLSVGKTIATFIIFNTVVNAELPHKGESTKFFIDSLPTNESVQMVDEINKCLSKQNFRGIPLDLEILFYETLAN